MATVTDSPSIPQSITSPESTGPAGNGLEQTPGMPYRFTSEEYLKMVAAGVLHEDSKVELLDGVIYPMSPSSEEHSFGILSISNLFRDLPKSYLTCSQLPLQIGTESIPEPDFMVLKGSTKSFRNRYIAPNDVVLLVEVSKSSAKFDRSAKLELYAKAGIPEYWIVDIDRKMVEVFTNPQPNSTPPSFQERKEYKPNETVAFTPVEGTTVEINVSEIFG